MDARSRSARPRLRGNTSASWGGGQPRRLPRVEDDQHALTEALSRCVARNDLVTIIAGSSAGEHDFTMRAIERLGEVLVHGIDIMPGKPAILATVRGKPGIGVPGDP